MTTFQRMRQLSAGAGSLTTERSSARATSHRRSMPSPSAEAARLPSALRQTAPT